MKIAVLSDIHGNSWALESVLSCLETRKPDLIVNLGDSLYGPLNPKETFHLIRSQNMLTISGNEDRLILEMLKTRSDNPICRFLLDELPEEAFDWLKNLPATSVVKNSILLCHGTPDSDHEYLLEKISDESLQIREAEAIEDVLKKILQPYIFCGHSHQPGIVQTSLHTILNPGSIGCPAFTDDTPVFHKAVNHNNRARFAMVELTDDDLVIEQLSLPYDVEKAVDCAIKNNRPDWATWLKTGKA